MTTSELSCCCNRTDCAHLTTAYQILNDLERDVHEAGTLGQALLERYEQNVAASEHEREELLAAMDALEKNKAALEDSNARMIEENRSLLDQLEDLNSAVADSDSHINTLNDTLDSTRKELQKLVSLANKATQLEHELTELEVERAKLDSELAVTQDEKHLARQRWRKAEDTIATLQDHIDEMGNQAVEERQRHTEMISRVKRQSEVKCHLYARQKEETASGATHPEDRGDTQDGVVTNFVRDILQDNSQLQLGIIELRELLLASNSEVNYLKSQVDMQPSGHQDSGASSRSLYAEMVGLTVPERHLDTVPELHVHHHYHNQKQLSKRPRKRSSITSSARRMPIAVLSSSKQEPQLLGEYASATDTIMSNTNVSIPTYHRAKWSIHSLATESSYAPSTVSGSPRNRASIFDSMDSVFDTTRTTTPATSTPGSPIFNRPLEDTRDIDLIPGNEPSLQGPYLDDHWAGQMNRESIIGAKEPLGPLPSQDQASNKLNLSEPRSASAVHRIRSHESLLSISGMDIHGPADRVSSYHKVPALLRPSGQPSVHSTSTMAAASAFSSPMSPTNKRRTDLSKSILEQHWQSPQQVKDVSSLKRVGGWVLGKWGAAPTSFQSLGHTSQRDSEAENNGDDKLDIVFRSPGINQPGPIFGMRKPHATPSSVQATFIDSGLLQESLQDT